MENLGEWLKMVKKMMNKYDDNICRHQFRIMSYYLMNNCDKATFED